MVEQHDGVSRSAADDATAKACLVLLVNLSSAWSSGKERICLLATAVTILWQTLLLGSFSPVLRKLTSFATKFYWFRASRRHFTSRRLFMQRQVDRELHRESDIKKKQRTFFLL